MKFTRTAGLFGATAVSAGCLLGIVAGSANAAATTFKDHETLPVAGDVFTCQGGDLTVTSGYITQTIEGNVDGQGVFHMTGTIVPHDVTLTDGVNTYTLSGASWFGAKASDPNGAPIVATSTDHFVIHNAAGGVYARVQVVEHISPNGTVIDFDLGQCEAPQD